MPKRLTAAETVSLGGEGGAGEPPDWMCVGRVLSDDEPAVVLAYRDGSMTVVSDLAVPEWSSEPLGALTGVAVGAVLDDDQEDSIVAVNADGELFVLDARRSVTQIFPVSSSASALAVASSGEVILGTADGRVQWLRLTPPEPTVTRSATVPGTVRSFGLLSSKRLAVGLDGGRVALIEADGTCSISRSSVGGVGSMHATGSVSLAVRHDESLVACCMDGSFVATDALGGALWSGYLEAPVSNVHVLEGGVVLAHALDGSVWLLSAAGRSEKLDVRPRPTAVTAGEYRGKTCLLMGAPGLLSIYYASALVDVFSRTSLWQEVERVPGLTQALLAAFAPDEPPEEPPSEPAALLRAALEASRDLDALEEERDRLLDLVRGTPLERTTSLPVPRAL